MLDSSDAFLLDICNENRLIRLPSSAGEIRKLPGLALFCNRAFTQFTNHAPGGCIVNIHVRGDPLAQTPDKPVIFDVVHSAVAGALGGLGLGFPQGVIIFFAVVLGLFESMPLAFSFNVDPVGIPPERTPSSSVG